MYLQGNEVQAQVIYRGMRGDRVSKGIAAQRSGVQVSRVVEHQEFESLQGLVAKRYEGVGIKASQIEFDMDKLQTLRVTDHSKVVGTLSVRADSSDGLAADKLFGDQVSVLRGQTSKICEVTRLAVDTDQSDKRLLAKLFHVCWLYAHFVQGADMMLFEVHPRHALIYQRLLGAKRIGEARMHPVGAEAQLACISGAHIEQQIALYAGREDLVSTSRTLYPYFYDANEEARIVQELIAGR